MNNNTNYELICKKLEAVMEGVHFEISNMANAAALLWEELDNINWVGFYILADGELKLGPFQGKVACTTIQIGRGVCGSAAAKNKTMLVENVHEFPGHIACDSASNSEIVIPIHKNKGIFGVLDIDSPLIGRFDDTDKDGLEKVVRVFEKGL